MVSDAEKSGVASWSSKVLNRVGAEKQKSSETDDQLYVKKAGLVDLCGSDFSWNDRSHLWEGPATPFRILPFKKRSKDKRAILDKGFIMLCLSLADLMYMYTDGQRTVQHFEPGHDIPQSTVTLNCNKESGWNDSWMKFYEHMAPTGAIPFPERLAPFQTWWHACVSEVWREIASLSTATCNGFQFRSPQLCMRDQFRLHVAKEMFFFLSEPAPFFGAGAVWAPGKAICRHCG